MTQDMKDTKHKDLRAILKTLTSLPLLSGPLLIGWQAVNWLKTGEWIHFTVMSEFNPSGTWNTTPDTWIGLHKILIWCLNSVPLSLVLMIVGPIVTFMLWAIIADMFDKPDKVTKS